MKIIAAVIGTGVGLKHLEAIDKFKNCRVKIICEKDKKKIKLLKKKFPSKYIVSDESKIFEDKSINLVSVASYDNYHFKQIKKCIKFKKHIIVEKPMALSMDDCDAMIGVSERLGVHLIVGHTASFNPVIQKIVKIKLF